MKSRWLSLCASLGLDGTETWVKIHDSYNSPERAYHNFTHIEFCLSMLDEYHALAKNPQQIELAIWFHDLVYDTHSHTNEADSATVAVSFLRETEYHVAVEQLILATEHRSEPQQADSRLIADIDLAILGSSEDAYMQYSKEIRKEYEWVPSVEFHSKRRDILQRLLDRTYIFYTEQMRFRLEEQARKNLKNELDSYQIV
ncbi:MAG: hypothetical protein AAF571_00545 [Verrucomicrobiota bacterium]